MPILVLIIRIKKRNTNITLHLPVPCFIFIFIVFIYLLCDTINGTLQVNESRLSNASGFLKNIVFCLKNTMN